MGFVSWREKEKGNNISSTPLTEIPFSKRWMGIFYGADYFHVAFIVHFMRALESIE